MAWRGGWIDSTDYYDGDVVSWEGYTYIARPGGGGKIPKNTEPPTGAWDVFAPNPDHFHEHDHSHPVEGVTPLQTTASLGADFDGSGIGPAGGSGSGTGGTGGSGGGGGGTVTSVSGTAPIQSTGGSDPIITILPATTSAAGSMSAADKTKLDGIEAGATTDQTKADIDALNIAASFLKDGGNQRSYPYIVDRANHTGLQLAATISDFQTQVRSNRLDQFGSPTADLNINAKRLTNVADPVADADAATRAYVETRIVGHNHDALVHEHDETYSQLGHVHSQYFLSADHTTAAHNALGIDAATVGTRNAAYLLNRANQTGDVPVANVGGFDSAVRGYRLDQFVQPGATLDFNNQRVLNVTVGPTPSAGDAANVGYVDTQIGGHEHTEYFLADNHTQTNHDAFGYLKEIEHTKALHDVLGIDAGTLDGLDSTQFARSDVVTNHVALSDPHAQYVLETAFDAHHHDAVYVNESDHTKVSHDALGIDAATVGGLNSTALLGRGNHTGTQPASTISDFNAAVRTNRLSEMAVPTTDINLNGVQLTNAGFAGAAEPNTLTPRWYVDHQTNNHDSFHDDRFVQIANHTTAAHNGLNITAANLKDGTSPARDVAYLVARANHTGTQPLSTVSGHNKTAHDGFGYYDASTHTKALHDSLSINAGTVGSATAAQLRDRATHTGTQTAATISDFNTAVRTNRLNELTAPSAAVSMASQKITNLATPTLSADAATKGYVDTQIATHDGQHDDRFIQITNHTKALHDGLGIDAATVGTRAPAYLLDRVNHTGSQTASTISDFNTAVRTNRLNQMASPSGAVSMANQKITSVGDPSFAQDAVNLRTLEARVGTASTNTNAYVDTQIANHDNQHHLNELAAVANVTVGGFKITNVGAPTLPADATNKSYVDNSVSTAVAPLASTSYVDVQIAGHDTQHTLNELALTGDLSLATRKITSLGSPVNPQDATNKGYVDGRVSDAVAPLAETTYVDNLVATEIANHDVEHALNELVPTANLSLGGFRIQNVGEPVLEADAATRGFVIDQLQTGPAGFVFFSGNEDPVDGEPGDFYYNPVLGQWRYFNGISWLEA